jgi:DHA2 family multidrug resistance protein
MAWSHIREPNYQPLTVGIDKQGVALLAVGMASLQYCLEEGNRLQWFDSPVILVLSAVAAVALVTFIVHELEVANPIVDLRVFSNRSYRAATGINFLIGTVLFSAGFLFSLYCGIIMRYKALDIGLLFLKGSAIQIIIMPMVGKFVGKVDKRLMISFGLTLLVYSLWLNGKFTNQSSNLQLLWPIFIRAVGLCFIFVPLSVVALSDLPPIQRGNAAGLFNLTRELGGSIGTAAMNSLLNHMSATNFQFLTSRVDQWNPLASEQIRNLELGTGWRFYDSHLGAMNILQLRLNLQALIKSFNESFTLLSLLFVLSLVLVFFLKNPEGAAADPGAH